jgi:GNAT superfamily N-acetyltransferase
MTLEIVDLELEHLEEAARLVAGQFRKERRQVPALPERFDQPEPHLQRLRDLARNNPGVAALRGGKLVGFLTGLVIPSWRSKRSAYAPAFAHGAAEEDRARIYRWMYGQMSQRWVDDRCGLHLISLFAHDRPAQDAWFAMAFGLTVVDAVRDAGQVRGASESATIRQATAEDAEAVTRLAEGLTGHLRSAPTLLNDEGTTVAETREWLTKERHALWLAEQDGQAVGYIRFQPPDPTVSHIVQDPGTASCTGAYVLPEVRGSGVAEALLKRAVSWAREEGLARCAVDFESENPTASGFWLKHYDPVDYSLIRYIDDAMSSGRSPHDNQP